MREDVEAVLAANREFYRAFAARDDTAMGEVWSRRNPVACIHPGWEPLFDRDQILRSWRQIMANPRQPDIECRDEIPHVIGEAAFVICQETVDGNVLVATNVFRIEDGDWKLVHHQSGPLAPTPSDEEEPPPPERLH